MKSELCEKELAFGRADGFISKQILIIGLITIGISYIGASILYGSWLLSLTSCIVSLLRHGFLQGKSYFGLIGIIGIFLIVYGLIVFLSCRECKLTITNKRVYGTAIWRKHIEFPIDFVSSIKLSSFGGIAISYMPNCVSETIRFKAISNNRQILTVVNNLLLQRENRAVSQNEYNSAFSTADELKKYKELFDMGAITPEEYSMKKKQLLKI